MSSYQAIKALGKWLAFPPKLAKVIGIEESIFLLNLCYVGSDACEWVVRSSEQLEEETTLTYKQQLRVREHLEALGLIEHQTKRPIHETKYRVFQDKFDELILTLRAKTEVDELTKSKLSEFRGGSLINSPKGSSSLQKEEEVQEVEKEKGNGRALFPKPVKGLPDWIPVEAWNGYVEMRKKIHAPLTERAMKLEVRELTKLRDQGFDPEAVLDQSVRKSWRGLFALKGDAKDEQREIIERAARKYAR